MVPIKKEEECIKLFEKVLGTKRSDSHTFDFLLGDKGTKLPVDAYFPDYKLVVEYMGLQHYVSVPHFDRKAERPEKRRRYFDRRREELPKHGIKLIEFKYDELLTEENVRKKLRDIGIATHPVKQ